MLTPSVEDLVEMCNEEDDEDNVLEWPITHQENDNVIWMQESF